MTTKRFWIVLIVSLLGAFGVLGFFGREVYRQAPPIPSRVALASNGKSILTKDDILLGQQVWQSIGGQQVGSIWGHGAYQAPDWSADWLHREATALRDVYAQRAGQKSFEASTASEQAAISARVRDEMRHNGFDATTGVVTISSERAEAIRRVGSHYASLFSDDPSLASLRESYALHSNAVKTPERRAALNAFFFWTAWSCTTERPRQAVTYTNNWPHEPLVGNAPTGANLVWSMLSIAVLILGVGALIAYRAFTQSKEAHDEEPAAPARDPLAQIRPTKSMAAVGRYLAVIVALFVVQVLLGALTAHYTVEGDSFFGIPLSRYLPYAVTRTWHIQLAVFWIATSFLAAGLFLAPAVGGREPKLQALGVNVLLGALFVVVAGSLAGEWVSVQQWLKLDASYWFGRQGYEYVDLGRFWQVALFVGLVLWLTLMLRGLWPALKERTQARQLVLIFAGASAAIGLFYGAGFFYGARTHLSVMEYWRWWVVHLWVEGFMEVFATSALAFIFSRLGLIRAVSATRAVLLTTSIFLVSGVPGTFHHLYFSGTPVSITAVGASFSALEVVPLALIGYEAWDTYRMGLRAPWMACYRWSLKFFLGVAFWNLVGAGVFGFLINPPIALYYMQGLNTTPVHGHAALFGVYGLLSLGLVLLVARRLAPEHEWRDGALAVAFWGMNVGLGLMIGLSLLPIGLIQTVASVDHGLWYARSAEFLQQPLLEKLRWARMVGDTVFLVGVGAFAWFMLGLKTGWSYVSPEHAQAAAAPSAAPAE
jgi:nitric oxide reductase subunit B